MIFYLQQLNILPVLQISPELHPERSEKIDDVPIYPKYIHDNTPNKHPKNYQSLGTLLIGFFEYYTNFDYGSQCISIRLGKLISKNNSFFKNTATPQIFCVEDPFIVIENTARTVSNHSLADIRAEFNRAFQLLKQRKSLSSIFQEPKKIKKERDKWKMEEISYIPYNKKK